MSIPVTPFECVPEDRLELEAFVEHDLCFELKECLELERDPCVDPGFRNISKIFR